MVDGEPETFEEMALYVPGTKLTIVYKTPEGVVISEATVIKLSGGHLTILYKGGEVPVDFLNWQRKFAAGELLIGEQKYYDTKVVQGNSGQYVVTIRDGKAISCTCLGFKYRATCRHLTMI